MLFKKSSDEKWIFGSFQLDFLGLFLPGYIGLIFVALLSDQAMAVVVLGFIAVVLIDSGHVYTTFLRGPFFKNKNNFKTLSSLFGIFIFLFTWLILKIPYFWSFIVYYTLFHHIRQYVGLIKWYNKLDHYYDSCLILFFYASVLVSMLLFHVNPNETQLFYSYPGDIKYIPSDKLFKLLLVIQLLIWAIYFFYACYLFLFKKVKPYKSHLFFVFAILFYFLVCLSNRQSPLVLVPILFAHGIPYILLIIHSKEKLQITTSKFKIIFLVLGFALMAALIEFGLQQSVIQFEYLASPDILPKVFLALFLTPLIFHYVIDGYIWKSKHFLAEKIYS